MTGLFGEDELPVRRKVAGHLAGAKLGEWDSLEVKAVALECWETDPWAPRRLLEEVRFPTGIVVDPCTGTGVLSYAARAAGYQVLSQDIADWGYPGLSRLADWLEPDAVAPVEGQLFTVFMNPPFSRACEFVDQALSLGAAEVWTFQRFPWLETGERRDFWDRINCEVVWVCADRVTCWLFTVPVEERKGSTPTTHAWFRFLPGPKQRDPLIRRLYKDRRG